MSFAIVVDSVADLSEEECTRFGITSVPLSVEVGGETFKDQVEISSEEFYDKMIASDTLPKSSQPSPSEFMDIYNALASEGANEIIAIHIAAVLSGTSESSNLAANQVEVPVEVIDSFNACSGQGLLALLACEMRDAGASAPGVRTSDQGCARPYSFLHRLRYARQPARGRSPFCRRGRRGNVARHQADDVVRRTRRAQSVR